MSAMFPSWVYRDTAKATSVSTAIDRGIMILVFSRNQFTLRYGGNEHE